MVQSPVLFITFSRPEYARQTWESIKLAQPKVLYFYSNKARADRVEEQERNDEIRSYIKEINWDCDADVRCCQFEGNIQRYGSEITMKRKVLF